VWTCETPACTYLRSCHEDWGTSRTSAQGPLWETTVGAAVEEIQVSDGGAGRTAGSQRKLRGAQPCAPVTRTQTHRTALGKLPTSAQWSTLGMTSSRLRTLSLLRLSVVPPWGASLPSLTLWSAYSMPGTTQDPGNQTQVLPCASGGGDAMPQCCGQFV
jgi:hypothetical protein